MEFSEQIKLLRKKNNLTQDHLAKKLGVTRQAVSNWENNKNLPDIEIIIRMSTEFSISLDQLILGDKDMNKVAKKLVKDGSEGRRAKMNMVTAIIGAVLMLMGVMCLFIKANSVEYVDSHGFLHENFYLLPVGFFLLFAGMLIILMTVITFVIKLHRQRKN